MGKKTELKPLRPFVIRHEYKQERCVAQARAFLRLRSRYEKLREKSKWERFLKHTARIHSEYRENLEEYFSAKNDLVRRSLVRSVVLAGKQHNMRSRLCIFALLDVFELLSAENRGSHGRELLRMIREGMLLDNDMEKIRVELAEQMRSMVGKFPEHLPDVLKFVSDCACMVVDIVCELSDDDIVMLADPFPDWEPVIAGFEDKLDEGILTESACAELENYVRELKTRHAVLTLELNEKSQRIERAMDYVAAPMNELPNSINGYEEEVLLIFTKLAQKEYMAWVAGRKEPQVDSLFVEAEDRYRHVDMMTLLGSHAEFWYVVLFQLLDSYTPLTENTLSADARRILATMIRHPTKLRKMSVPAGYDKLKGRLKRYVSPCLKGFHPDEEDYLINERLEEDLEPRHYVDLVAEYISLSFFKDNQFGIQSDGQLKALEKAWSDIFEPLVEKVATHFCLEVLGHDVEELKTLEDTASEHEFQEYMQEYLEAEPEEFDIDLEADLVTQEHIEPAPPRRNWYYVPHLAAPEKGERIEFAGTDKGDALDTFFGKRNIKTVIKSKSIANALDYYVGLPENVRQLMPKESLGEYSWDKLKRGKLRIVARIEDEDLFFHIFPRKEWKRDMFDI